MINDLLILNLVMCQFSDVQITDLEIFLKLKISSSMLALTMLHQQQQTLQYCWFLRIAEFF
jgi:hypothetical protein